VPVHNLAVAADQARDFESELANRLAHAVDGAAVFSRIAWILSQTVNRPDLDAQRGMVDQHWHLPP